MLPKTEDNLSTQDIANKFIGETAKLRSMSIGPDNVLGQETSLITLLELIATYPLYKGHIDEYAAAQEKRGEHQTVEHILRAKEKERERLRNLPKKLRTPEKTKAAKKGKRSVAENIKPRKKQKQSTDTGPRNKQKTLKLQSTSEESEDIDSGAQV